jgi:hypothetical protein
MHGSAILLSPGKVCICQVADMVRFYADTDMKSAFISVDSQQWAFFEIISQKK